MEDSGVRYPFLTCSDAFQLPMNLIWDISQGATKQANEKLTNHILRINLLY